MILRTMCLTRTTHRQTPFRLVRYTCIARMRFGNQIMNKYHIIACKLWVIYAWCRRSFNSYSSSHSKSISFYKKIGPLWFVGFPKWGNRKNMGLEWNVVLNPTGLYECLIVHKKCQILSKRFEWMGCFLWNLVQMNPMEKFLWFTILRIKQPR